MRVLEIRFQCEKINLVTLLLPERKRSLLR